MVRWRKSFLKSDGKFVTINVSDSGPELCAKEIQGGSRRAPMVWICTRPKDGRNQVAFCCKHGADWYFAKVEETILQLERTSDISGTLPESCWFQKVNTMNSSRYVLQSVNRPTLYLCIVGKKLYAGDQEKIAYFTNTYISVNHSKMKRK